jgi:hypothetical protein
LRLNSPIAIPVRAFLIVLQLIQALDIKVRVVTRANPFSWLQFTQVKVLFDHKYPLEQTQENNLSLVVKAVFGIVFLRAKQL